MLSKDKLLTTMLAAKEAGHERLHSPTIHSLIYHLKHQNISFPEYIFTTYGSPAFGPFLKEKRRYVEHPYCLELSQGLEEWWIARFLEKKLSVVSYSPTLIAFKNKTRFQKLLDEEGEIKFNNLVKLTGQALEDPRNLIEETYRIYLYELKKPFHERII